MKLLFVNPTADFLNLLCSWQARVLVQSLIINSLIFAITGLTVFSQSDDKPLPSDKYFAQHAIDYLNPAEFLNLGSINASSTTSDSHFQVAKHISDDLRKRAEENGSVRVIVRLNVKDYQIEADLAHQQFGNLSETHLSRSIEESLSVSDQRQRIADTQNALLEQIAAFNLVEESIKTYKYIPFIALAADDTLLNFLKTSPLVLSVIEDEMETMTLAESTARIGANTAWSNGYTGLGQTIAILDTGVEKRHNLLVGKVVSEACYSTNDAASNVSSACPNGAVSSTAVDSGLPLSGSVIGAEHGTHVAGIVAGKEGNGQQASTPIYGVAKDASLIAIQVFSKVDNASVCAGAGEPAPCARTFVSDQYKGLERIYEIRNSYNIAAANMSLGSGRFTTNCDAEESGPGGRKLLIDQLRAVGTATVIASGNSGYRDAVGKPACISTAISVGATLDTADTVATYSNHSSGVSLLAPGSDIVSSVYCSGTNPMSGTSMATPHVAGAWGLLRQKNPAASVTDILNVLQTTGIPVSAGNAVKRRIRVDAALAALGGSGAPICTAQTPKRTFIGKTVNGQLATGDCVSGGYFDEYTFYGGGNRKLAIEVNSENFNTRVVLQSPVGKTISEISGSNSTTRLPNAAGYITLPENGTYKIQVYGQGTSATGSYSVLVTSDTLLTDLAPDLRSHTKATAINNAGLIVGGSSGGSESALTFKDGTITNLTYGSLHRMYFDFGLNLYPLAVNEAGDIAGYKDYSSSPGSLPKAVLFKNGTLIDVVTGSHHTSEAKGINDQGQVVGFMQSNTSPYKRAFLYSGGVTRDLGLLPGSRACYANDINNAGQIVGYCDYDSHGAAFIYQNGVMTELPGETVATAINELGQVVGWARLDNIGDRAFLYSNGVMTNLGTLPGGTRSYATGINDLGQIVGYSDTQCGFRSNAFVYSGGAMHDLGTLGGVLSQANGINNSGVVVGWAWSEAGISHAFKTKLGENLIAAPTPPRQMTALPILPGATNCYATNANDFGHVVGYCSVTGGERAFWYRNGVITDLGTLGGTVTRATGINNTGQIVGYSTLSTGSTRAFRYSNGAMTNLGLPPDTLESRATGINDQGQIIGGAIHPGGYLYMFLHSNNAFTRIALTASPDHGPKGINNNGQVIGNMSSSVSARTSVFVYNNGQVTYLTLHDSRGETSYDPLAFDINSSGNIVGKQGIGLPLQHRDGRTLPLLASSFGEATAINDLNEIVGYTRSGTPSIKRAFVYTGGRLTAAGYQYGKTTELGTLGGSESNAVDINNSGQIVGSSQIANGQFRAFITNSSRRGSFDFDGDGKADISVFRPTTGGWYINRSSNNSFFGTGFGIAEDKPAAADFDGDGKTDIAVFRPSVGSWYRLNSSNNQFVGLQFGQAGDVPVPGDYDGDGKADISVFRPSTGSWYRLNSSNNQFVGIQFGTNGDVPIKGDFDGDGKSDLAVFRPINGAWYILRSTNGSFYGVGFGLQGDIPTPADYDGDGKTDVSVFRPSAGAWYRLNSSTNQFFGQQFGTAEDIPVAADYDGDGKADLAVFRPSAGGWYLQRSTSGFTGQQFGTTGDVPTPSILLP
jgi:probable HAF family extracellular repeat protein